MKTDPTFDEIETFISANRKLMTTEPDIALEEAHFKILSLTARLLKLKEDINGKD